MNPFVFLFIFLVTVLFHFKDGIIKRFAVNAITAIRTTSMIMMTVIDISIIYSAAVVVIVIFIIMIIITFSTIYAIFLCHLFMPSFYAIFFAIYLCLAYLAPLLVLLLKSSNTLCARLTVQS